MIEVEKKFILSKEDEARLTEEAEFLGEKTMEDAYYDTADYTLTSQDIWLRERDRRWELKLPLHKGAERLGDQYRELTDENEIREYLKIPPKKTLAQDLEDAGYMPFCVFKTVRRKYKKMPFVIDLDAVDFGDFSYALGEVELLINDHDDMNEAMEKIMEFGRKNGLEITHVRGKVIEYLKRVKPEHYQTLVKANVVKDF
ncbi:MAG: CYTH domain-containing protein [bacterium]|nr:CYTH domain-containing protein [bacterium]